MKKLYIETTWDKYELPVAVGDSPKELAEQIGIKPHSVLTRISHGKSGDCRSTIYRVEYTDEEWNDEDWSD